MVTELSAKQKEVLLYKTRLNETVQAIMTLMVKENLDDSAVNMKIQDVYYSLSCIGTIVGGRMADRINSGIFELRKQIALIKAMTDQGDVQQIPMELWLGTVNSLVVKFDDQGRPMKVMFDFEAMGVKLKALVLRGKA
ncbi:MAG TPA: hypothetical protein VGQ13_04030 [Nitrososphaera sp.]|nr:hypothetical protein [Nitrososphaera sp.]